MFMWPRSFPWPGATKLCSGEGEELLVDGISGGEICWKGNKTGFSTNITTVSPCSSPAKRPPRVCFVDTGTVPRPDCGLNITEWARKLHDFGRYAERSVGEG
jgi:hypothetical protein